VSLPLAVAAVTGRSGQSTLPTALPGAAAGLLALVVPPKPTHAKNSCTPTPKFLYTHPEIPV